MLNYTVNPEDKKRLLSNFFSLSALQGVNYILPLITLPYLVRILGVEYFGVLSFASSTVAYFSLITDFGFNLTATREISINRNDKNKLIEIFSSVLIIKFVLILISFFLLSILVFIFDKFKVNSLIYFLSFGVVLGQFLFPVWFFQGMEKMKYITYLNIFAKLIFTVAIFIFVQNKNDFWIVPLLTSSGFILAGFFSLFLIKKEFGVSFALQEFVILKHYFLESYHIFFSKLAISLYTISTTFILGILTNNTIVGYYSAAEKIIGAFKGLLQPALQTIYPFISKKTHQSKEEGLIFIRKIVFYIGIFAGFISFFILFFADFLVDLLLGNQYQNSIIIVRILAAMPFMIGLSNVFGIQTMLNFGRRKAFTKILVSGSILNLFLAFTLVPSYQHIGSAISVLAVESFITTAMFIYLQNNGLKIVRANK